MLWEFGELGYDYSRCYLSSNGEGGDCNTKLDPKPIKWDYYQVPDRKALYDVYTKLFALKKNQLISQHLQVVPLPIAFQQPPNG